MRHVLRSPLPARRLSRSVSILLLAGLTCAAAFGAGPECRDTRSLAILEAEKGADALTVRAWRYYNGAGVPADRKHALDLWQQAAAAGNARAIARLGQPRPHAEAAMLEYKTDFDRVAEAVAKKDPLAAVVFGRAYLGGQIGGDKGKSQGLILLEGAAERGSVAACVEMALFFDRSASRNAQNAKEWMARANKLAEKNPNLLESEDMVALGRAWASGVGGVKDLSRAMTWFEGAAKLGDPVAMEQLALGYAGLLSHEDKEAPAAKTEPALARQWAAQAVRGQYARANILLAYLNLGGIGGDPDAEYAADLLLRPVEVGYPDARRMLGMMYLSGRGVMRNTWRAETLLTQAAEDGDVEAMWSLVRAYHEGGMGLARDNEKAAFWLGKAYEKGDPKAKAMLEEFRRARTATQPATQP